MSLEKYEVLELTEEDKNSIDGGFPFLFLGLCIGIAAIAGYLEGKYK